MGVFVDVAFVITIAVCVNWWIAYDVVDGTGMTKRNEIKRAKKTNALAWQQQQQQQ